MPRRKPPAFSSLRVFAIVVGLAALCAVAIGPGLASREEPQIDDVLAQVRGALFGHDGVRGGEFIELRGPARIFDMELDGVLVFDGHLSYRTEFTGDFVQISGHDGTITWEQSPGGNVQRLEAGNASFSRLFGWFLTGQWVAPESGLSLSVDRASTRRGMVGLHVDAGHGAEGVILIDRETWLPEVLRTTQFGREKTATLEWGERVGGVAVPRRLEMTDDGKTFVRWEIEQRSVLAQAPSFSQPSDAIKVVYDRSVAPELRTIKASGGHLWVRPLINGKDVGWFLFDTGANGTVIDERIARDLGLVSFGDIDSTGMGGRAESEIRKVGSMQLAGVRIEDVPIVSRDLSSKNRSMGVDVAGYLGVDLLAQGVIVYNERDVEISFHVPDMYDLLGGRWVKMPIHNSKPAVQLEYEGHSGLFVIDTGAPGRLIIGPHVVDRHNLLKGRKTQQTRAYGTGGSVSARNGALDWVEWGGRRFKNVPTMFVTEDKGAGADVLRDGIVGANLIRRFVVVFDIEGERIAFLEHE